MRIILSPARNVRPACLEKGRLSRPRFADKTMELVGLLRAFSPWQLESLLDVPAERALVLYEAYQRLDATKGEGWPALCSFYGAAYRNMQPQDFTAEELDFANEHLRILSALYGMLLPLDAVEEHRLGLKRAFSPGGQDLHAYWGDCLYRRLYQGRPLVVNLASQEYAKLVVPYMKPGDRMLHCRFLVAGPGGTRGTVSTVRAARGLMTRFIVKNRITRPEDLQDFSEDGYRFVKGKSSNEEYVFVKQKAPSLLLWN